MMTRLPGMRVRPLIVAWVVSLATIVGGATMAFAQPSPAAKPARVAGDARAADRDAIAATLTSFAQAFKARDAQALADHWTSEGEYENDAGLRVQGRDGLTRAFGEFFARTPELSAEMRPGALRFIGRDIAEGDGTVTIRKGPAQPATRARYSALLVREEGRWRLAKLGETTDNDPDIVADLGWLIGQWRSKSGESAEIHTTYSWSPSKKFVHVDFTIKENGLSLTGKQVIGIDPATKQLRSWTFEADGGVGEADWTRDGDHWVLDASGTLADGRSLVETNILRRVNDDTFTWQSIDRLLDGEVLADLPPLKVSRVKAE